MRNFYAVFALIISAFSVQGQNIPDANFANAIRSQCPACIDANDNLLPAAATRAYLDVSQQGISSLTGVGGFVGLTTLNCANNQLTTLPALPSGLVHLDCSNNPQLSCLPVLPNTLQWLGCDTTDVVCIPNLPPLLANRFAVPMPPFDSLAPFHLPICHLSSNPNNCLIFSHASGQVYFDLNANSVFDAGDIAVPNQLLTSSNNSFAAATNAGGFYSLALDTNTTSIISLPVFYNSNYFSVSPAFHTITTGANFQSYPNNDFIVSPAGNFDDLEVDMFGGWHRSGFDAVLYIAYKNVGATTISGSLSLDLDSDVNFITSSEPSVQAGQNLSFNFSNLAPFETRTIWVWIDIDASVALGTAINHTLNGIVANDADLTNNQHIMNDIVRSSYDPNDINADKDALCSNYNSELEEDLTYTIRFQNTGNFYAQYVLVEDTLSNLLDIATFQQIAASHDYRLVFDNVVVNGQAKVIAKWYFDDIMLADSFSNEPLSHGYIKYKIKPLAASLSNRNEIIASQAHIYFDFNAAVNTNIDEIRSEICMGVNQSASERVENSFQILPNPNKGNFSLRFAESVSLENANLYIYNYLGELVAQQNLQNANSTVAINNLPAAAYIVKVQAENAIFVQKMIVE